jgi:hypothetical protein
MELRPMGAGEILDGAIRLYRDNFASLILITAAIYIPAYTVGQALTGLLPMPPGDYGQLLRFTGGFGSALLFLLGYPLGSGALAYAVSEYLLGRPVALRDVLRGVRGWLPPLAGAVGVSAALILGIVTFSMVLVLAMFLSIGLPRLATQTGAAFGATLAVLTIGAASVPLVTIFIRWQLFPQAVVLERSGIRGALARSWSLTAGSFWRLLSTMSLLTVLVEVVRVAIAGIGVAAMTLAFGRSLETVAWLGQSTYTLTGVVLEPVRMAAMTLIYYDLRIRREGFDLERLAAEVAKGTARGPSEGAAS